MHGQQHAEATGRVLRGGRQPGELLVRAREVVARRVEVLLDERQHPEPGPDHPVHAWLVVDRRPGRPSRLLGRVGTPQHGLHQQLRGVRDRQEDGHAEALGQLRAAPQPGDRLSSIRERSEVATGRGRARGARRWPTRRTSSARSWALLQPLVATAGEGVQPGQLAHRPGAPQRQTVRLRDDAGAVEGLLARCGVAELASSGRSPRGPRTPARARRAPRPSRGRVRPAAGRPPGRPWPRAAWAATVSTRALRSSSAASAAHSRAAARCSSAMSQTHAVTAARATPRWAFVRRVAGPSISRSWWATREPTTIAWSVFPASARTSAATSSTSASRAASVVAVLARSRICSAEPSAPAASERRASSSSRAAARSCCPDRSARPAATSHHWPGQRRVRGLDRVEDGARDEPALGGQQVVEHGVPGQRVPEAELRPGLGDQELRIDTGAERCHHVEVGHLRCRRQQRPVEASPQDGRHLQHAGRLGAEPAQPAAHAVHEAHRQRRAGLGVERPPFAVPRERTRADGAGEHLLHHERQPVGPGPHVLHDPARVRRRSPGRRPSSARGRRSPARRAPGRSPSGLPSGPAAGAAPRWPPRTARSRRTARAGCRSASTRYSSTASVSWSAQWRSSSTSSTADSPATAVRSRTTPSASTTGGSWVVSPGVRHSGSSLPRAGRNGDSPGGRAVPGCGSARAGPRRTAGTAPGRRPAPPARRGPARRTRAQQ